MATHSSVLAWRIPGMGEPGGLPSMGSQSRTRLKRLSSSSIVCNWPESCVLGVVWGRCFGLRCLENLKFKTDFIRQLTLRDDFRIP